MSLGQIFHVCFMYCSHRTFSQTLCFPRVASRLANRQIAQLSIVYKYVFKVFKGPPRYRTTKIDSMQDANDIVSASPSSPPSSPLPSPELIFDEVEQAPHVSARIHSQSSSLQTGVLRAYDPSTHQSELMVPPNIIRDVPAKHTRRSLGLALYRYRFHMQKMEFFWNSIQRIARDNHANNCVVCLELEFEIRTCLEDDNSIRNAFRGDENLEVEDMEDILSSLRRTNDRRIQCLNSLLEAVGTYCHRPLIGLAPGQVSKKMRQFVHTFQEFQ